MPPPPPDDCTKVPPVPFPITISSDTKPVTDSLKVTVIGIGTVLVGDDVADEMITVGVINDEIRPITGNNYYLRYAGFTQYFYLPGE